MFSKKIFKKLKPLKLPKKDFERLLKEIENPPKPNEALIEFIRKGQKLLRK